MRAGIRGQGAAVLNSDRPAANLTAQVLQARVAGGFGKKDGGVQPSFIDAGASYGHRYPRSLR
jgi:hypothetical protein